MSDKSKILIVDDEPIGRQLLEAVLFDEGFDLIFAEDGGQALEIIFTELPDLILMDVMMPEMDGFEVCQKIRKNEKTHQIPVILITALDDRDSRIRGLDAGADDYISKPFDRVEILAKVKNITQLNRYRQIIDIEPSSVDTKTKSVSQTDYSDLYSLALPPIQFIKRFFPLCSCYPVDKKPDAKNMFWLGENNQFVCFALFSIDKSDISSDKMLIFYFLLEQTFKSIPVSKASDILNGLKKKLEEFKKENNRNDIDLKEFTISLLALNKNNFDAHYSGYNLPGFIIKSDGITETDYNDIKSFEKKNEFSDYKYQLERNATIIFIADSLYSIIKKDNLKLSNLAIQVHNYPENFKKVVTEFIEKEANKFESTNYSIISLKV